MGSGDTAASAEILKWLEKGLENEHLKSFEIILGGTSEKCDGFFGNITFATVNGVTNENEEKTLHLAIKSSIQNEYLRELVGIKRAYETEICMYTKVFPAYKQLQHASKVEAIFQSVPTCHATLVLDNVEVIILDNLKKGGYELYDRKKPLNLYHLKKVLGEYGKFHALSFALKELRNKDFNRFVMGLGDAIKLFISSENGRETVDRANNKVLRILKERNEEHLYEKAGELLEKGAANILNELLNGEESQSVIVHGDCWNNNFMFKYATEDRRAPAEMAILDFQTAALRSPAFDLSHLIYSVSSKEELSHFDELLETYYASFSKLLRQLGSDPEKLFPFSDLKAHWEKYSLFGLIFMPVVMEFALCDKEKAPVFEELEDGKHFGDMENVDVADDLFYVRVRDALSHYFVHSK